MSNLPDALWLNTSPSLRCFAQPLLRYLSHHTTIAQWDYCQSQDEASSLEAAILLLHDYLKFRKQPIHLMGHSTGGLLGLLYARRYPEKVKSLSLFAVGVDAALDWQAHYYVHRPFIDRQRLLTVMVYNLFGYRDALTIKRLEDVLEQDLDCSLSPHSLLQQQSMLPEAVPVPLLVCGSTDDLIIEPCALQAWQPWLKAGDRLWECPEGRHFFHYFQAQPLAKEVLNFWQSLSLRPLSLSGVQQMLRMNTVASVDFSVHSEAEG
ncbi:hypothetical protein AVDCRST_MAG94-5870 [uncultured Leptolyngbya sp.]|uniref:AB hydrolase-1 domain-containing protein n=1 Tax=uncultured Leptolyngbya sp. TaxID=332963 RepID=A0A6J4P1Z7_9CYAN|nr:hypothetical protein AVDCRST_MAG94-5870 [uncultured Leptolyngbya sp.]